MLQHTCRRLCLCGQQLKKKGGGVWNWTFTPSPPYCLTPPASPKPAPSPALHAPSAFLQLGGFLRPPSGHGIDHCLDADDAPPPPDADPEDQLLEEVFARHFVWHGDAPTPDAAPRPASAPVSLELRASPVWQGVPGPASGAVSPGPSSGKQLVPTDFSHHSKSKRLLCSLKSPPGDRRPPTGAPPPVLFVQSGGCLGRGFVGQSQCAV